MIGIRNTLISNNMKRLLKYLFVCCICILNMSAMAQSASGIKGKVMCQGKGISNVVVTIVYHIIGMHVLFM